MILIPTDRTIWPSGLRRWLQAPVRKGVGSNPTVVTFFDSSGSCMLQSDDPNYSRGTAYFSDSGGWVRSVWIGSGRFVLDFGF